MGPGGGKVSAPPTPKILNSLSELEFVDLRHRGPKGVPRIEMSRGTIYYFISSIKSNSVLRLCMCMCSEVGRRLTE